MGDAGGSLGGVIPGSIAGQGIGHLDRRLAVLTLVEDLGQMLPGMIGPGFEQRDEAVGGLGHHPGGKDPGALGLGPRGQGLGARRGGEFQDACGGVIVVEHCALGGLADEFPAGRCQTGRGLGDDLPRGGGRQRDGQRLLEPLDAVKRQAAAVFEERDHGRGARVVFVLAHPGRGGGGKHRPAQAATQALQGIDLRLQGRHAGDPHQDRGLLALDVDPSATVGFGTGVAVLEGGMGERDARGAGVVLGAVASMALARGLALSVTCGGGRLRAPTARVGVGRGRARRAVFAQDRVGALTARPEDQAAHPLQGRGLGLQLLGQARQGVHRRLKGGVFLRR